MKTIFVLQVLAWGNQISTLNRLFCWSVYVVMLVSWVSGVC